MARPFECAHCGSSRLDVHDYSSMIVVSSEYALFSVKCSACGRFVSSLRRIPADMRDEVLFAAIEVGAGMGRSC